MKYKKKPVIIDAIQLTESTFLEICHLLEKFSVLLEWQWEQGSNNNYVMLKTLEGNMKAKEFDWIIKGVAGEFYPCKPEIFEETYEIAE